MLGKRKRNVMRILLKATFIVFILVSLAHGRIARIPVEDMPAEADFIIMGTVVYKSARWSDAREIMIYTDYTIQVEENIKGDKPSQIVMSFAGGTVEGKTIYVTDTPVLKVGEKYILFGYEKYSVPVVGHEQGVFRVIHDSVRQDDFVVDYHWRQLETDGKVIFRGPRTVLDSRGALTVLDSVHKKKPEDLLRPVIRGDKGRVIPQEPTVFAKPEPKRRGVPATKSAFVDFIRKKVPKGGHKK
jgi:hypothetical protein